VKQQEQIGRSKLAETHVTLAAHPAFNASPRSGNNVTMTVSRQVGGRVSHPCIWSRIHLKPRLQHWTVGCKRRAL